MNGFEICRRLKKNHKDVQVVIVTCLDDLESKIKGVEVAADDFLVKLIVARELKAKLRVLLEKKGHLDEPGPTIEKPWIRPGTIGSPDFPTMAIFNSSWNMSCNIHLSRDFL